MTALATNSYLASLLAGRPQVSATPLAWLNDLRALAVDRAGVLTVPNTRDEDWRFTDISPLTKISFQPARSPVRIGASEIERFALPEAAARLTFVDGVYTPDLSFNSAGIVVENIAAGLTAHTAEMKMHLGQHVAFHDNAFAALNTAFLHDGALIIVPRNTAIAAPLHLLFVASEKGTASYPRCLVVAGRGSAVTVVEDFVTLHGEASFTNAVTEIALADNAAVTHMRVQRESPQAFHIANCAVRLSHASRYESASVAFGSSISRYNLNVVQDGEGAECSIDGLALIGERQLADTHTFIDHAKPHGVSRQRHKCIVGGAAHAVFNGKIMVRQDAQRTDSSQSSRNLLLSAKSRVDTKPQLEIFADDVKCAHGATVGQLDADELFYLRSRGLTDTAARNLLTYAFGAEILDRIPIATLRHRLEQTVLEQTSAQS